MTATQHTRITAADAMERLFPGNDDASQITIECRRSDYSASAIARAVEDCDAHLLNLNVTAQPGSSTGSVVVDLRVSHRNSNAVARSLERYGFHVTDFDEEADDPIAAKARDNANQLLKYIES